MSLTERKQQILSALSHPEAEAGLYLDNLMAVHEDEERIAVEGTQLQVLEALRELIHEGRVEVDESTEQVIFSLRR